MLEVRTKVYPIEFDAHTGKPTAYESDKVYAVINGVERYIGWNYQGNSIESVLAQARLNAMVMEGRVNLSAKLVMFTT